MRATNARSWFPSLTVGLTVVCLAPFAAAQVALDGTTGPAGPLAGPDYAITAELGRRAGGNLFHSFERFSLRTNESATFSGPDGIANVISRVTGGARSDIDGTLRLTIPGADLWFLNPAGVIFGPNARLDVQGSFHVSTADELRFADGTRFSARNAAASTFTVAPPEAFGFLEADPGPIEVKQSQLFVPQGQILSMIGGGIGISGRDNLSIVAAPNGQINLVSMELPGLVTITQDNIKNPSVDKLGHLEISNALVLTGLLRPGKRLPSRLRIRARSLMISDARLFVDNLLSSDYKGTIDISAVIIALLSSSITVDAIEGGGMANVRIQARELAIENADLSVQNRTDVNLSGRIDLNAETMTVRNNSTVTANTRAAGQAADIRIKAGEFVVENHSVIDSNSEGAGEAGMIDIDLHGERMVVRNASRISSRGLAEGTSSSISVNIPDGTLELSENSFLASSARGSGNGGSIEVEADQVLIIGSGFDRRSGIATLSDASGAGANQRKAGNIVVRANRVELSGGGQISSGTRGLISGGAIQIEAKRLVLADAPTMIESSVGRGAEGNAGPIHLVVGELELREGSFIGSSALGHGAAGSIEIAANRVMIDGGPFGHATGIDASAFGSFGPLSPERTDTSSSPPRNINITTGSLEILPSGAITATTGSAFDSGSITIRVTDGDLLLLGGGITNSTLPGASGAAGAVGIDILAGELVMANGALIASNNNAGHGTAGQISVAANGLTLINRSNIEARTSGSGSGGTIDLNARDHIFVSNSKIRTSSEGIGDAGDLSIRAGSSLKFRGATVSSEADLAGGGQIIIRAGRLLDLKDSKVISSVAGQESSNAGNIDIDPRFIVLDSSDIQAKANKGAGGIIELRFGTLFRSPDSTIDASAGPAGIDGTVRLDGPEEAVSGGLIALPSAFLDASLLLPESCAARRSTDLSSFTAAGRGGLPPGPDAPLPGFYALGPDASAPSTESSIPRRERPASGARPADAARLTLVLPCGDRTPGARPRG